MVLARARCLNMLLPRRPPAFSPHALAELQQQHGAEHETPRVQRSAASALSFLALGGPDLSRVQPGFLSREGSRTGPNTPRGATLFELGPLTQDPWAGRLGALTSRCAPHSNALQCPPRAAGP